MSGIGKRLERLGLVPDVVPITVLAELLEVPAALLLDEVVRGELVVVVPWSLGKFEDVPNHEGVPKLPPLDLYAGETPPAYVGVETVAGGSDVLYSLLRHGGRVSLRAGAIHERDEDGWPGGPRIASLGLASPLELELADLLVPWAEVRRRGWDLADHSEAVDSVPNSRAQHRNVLTVLELLIRRFAAMMESPEAYGTETEPLRTNILNAAVEDAQGARPRGLSETQIGTIAKLAKEHGTALDAKAKRS